MPSIDSELIFRVTAGLLLVMQNLSRFWMTRGREVDGASRFFHRSREQFFIRLSGGAMVLAYLYVFFPDLTGWVFPVPAGLRWAGAALMLTGNILFILAHKQLGRQWSPELELQPDHQLIIRGIYTKIRHPMYTGFLVFGLGLIMLTANIFGCAYLPAVVLMVIVRLPSEEAMMVEEFGQAYTDYCRRTRALIPWIF